MTYPISKLSCLRSIGHFFNILTDILTNPFTTFSVYKILLYLFFGTWKEGKMCYRLPLKQIRNDTPSVLVFRLIFGKFKYNTLLFSFYFMVN